MSLLFTVTTYNLKVMNPLHQQAKEENHVILHLLPSRNISVKFNTIKIFKNHKPQTRNRGELNQSDEESIYQKPTVTIEIWKC